MSAQRLNPDPLQSRLMAAQRLIASGRLDEGEFLLGDLVKSGTPDPEALCALAAVALARRQVDRAFEILAKAATVFPDHVGLVTNLGHAHQAAGRTADAAICFARAVAMAPHDATPRLALATARLTEGRTDDASGMVESVLQEDAANAEAWGLRGMIALVRSDYTAAEAALEHGLTLAPDDANLVQRLSICLLQQGRVLEAIDAAERAHLLAPLDTGKFEHLATCLAVAGRYAEAEAVCRQILAFAPASVTASELLARVMIATDRSDEALATMTRIVRGNQTDSAALLALARTLRLTGQHEKALGFVSHALQLQPGNPQAVVLKTDLELVLGRLPVGQGPLAADLPAEIQVPPDLTPAEMLLLARYAVRVGQVRSGLRLGADAKMLPLLRRLRTDMEIVALDQVVAAPTVGALMLDLGGDAAAFAAMIPYVAPLAAKRDAWAAALAEFPRPLIGVAFDDAPRQLDLAHVQSIVGGRGTVISLVVGPARHKLADWPAAIDAGRHCGDVDEMLAAIDCLDVVVGPDCIALHMAGALGRPAIALVAADFHWGWAARAGRSIWYPQIQVVRQDRAGSWDAATRMARERLALLIDAQSSSSEETSPA